MLPCVALQSKAEEALRAFAGRSALHHNSKPEITASCQITKTVYRWKI
jgi:hypothetical protein